ncbi:MAG: hypothetical protein KJ634_01030 [Gammaproteobacteria bacterium]|nr:hypothetical protein [Gammaproteobacteria bacterium]MBU1414182.1 hypothetical protein [Gammaproteobacteria bacterium]
MEMTLEEALAKMKALKEEREAICEPWHSFWYHRPSRRFPPQTVQSPDEYDGSDRLCVACTQTDLSASAQKKLVERWCRELPQMTEVRYLWFQSKTTQAMFEAACRNPSLEGLYVKWGSISSIDSLPQLKSLKYLHLSSAGIESLEPLSCMPQLVWLELCKARGLRDLTPLSQLQNLEGLMLTGDTNSLGICKTQTLRPLASLKRLKWLVLRAFVAEDGSLDPLGTLSDLQQLIVSNRFPVEEFARLSARLPDTECDAFIPHSEPLVHMGFKCKKCRIEHLVLLTGKASKSYLCPVCDAKRLAAHVAKFEAAAAAVRNAQ